MPTHSLPSSQSSEYTVSSVNFHTDCTPAPALQRSTSLRAPWKPAGRLPAASVSLLPNPTSALPSSSLVSSSSPFSSPSFCSPFLSSVCGASAAEVDEAGLGGDHGEVGPAAAVGRERDHLRRRRVVDGAGLAVGSDAQHQAEAGGAHQQRAVAEQADRAEMGVVAVVEHLAGAVALDAEQLALGTGRHQQTAFAVAFDFPDVGLVGIVEHRGLAVGVAVHLAVGRAAGVDRALGVRPHREHLGLLGGEQHLDLAALVDAQHAAGVAGPDHPAVAAGKRRRREQERLLDRRQSFGAMRQSQDAERVDADRVELAGAERLLRLGEEQADLGRARGRSHEADSTREARRAARDRITVVEPKVFGADRCAGVVSEPL